VVENLQVASAAELPRQTGNMYTASLWAGLASLISELGDELLACQVTASAPRH
jgi:3-hydroxy-3-methylglutaryl CoA synthase